MVLPLAFAAGGLTSIGQLLLPGILAPLANSSSGWTLVAAGAVALTRPPVLRGAALGALAFAALTLGYALVSSLRGYSFDPSLWLVVGLVAGPVVGAATALLGRGDRRIAGAAVGVLSGILIGEGGYGLLVIAGTTGVAYWIAILVLGALALPGAAVRHRWPLGTLLWSCGVAVSTAGLLLLGYVVVLPALL